MKLVMARCISETCDSKCINKKRALWELCSKTKQITERLRGVIAFDHPSRQKMVFVREGADSQERPNN